jgi:putative DNA primase/helicase
MLVQCSNMPKFERNKLIAEILRDQGMMVSLGWAWIIRKDELEAHFIEMASVVSQATVSTLRISVKERASAILKAQDASNRGPDDTEKPPKRWACPLVDETEPEVDVLAALDRTKDGRARPTPLNVARIMEFDSRLYGRIRLNEFSHAIHLDAYEIRDEDASEIAYWVSQTYGMDVPIHLVTSAASALARRHGFHPVQDYLESLKWDGTERLDGWLARYSGTDDDSMSSIYGRKFLISCVARILRPGEKVHTLLILQGEQGVGKSTMFEILAGEWFSDTLIPIGSKDAHEMVSGVWLYELAELDAFSKREMTAINAFITSPNDRFRPSFGRYVKKFVRQCVFCGTTNKAQFLRDPTGARRFWVRSVVRPMDLAGLARVRDQLWAEAVVRLRAGEPWHLDAVETSAHQVDAAQWREEDPWEDTLKTWLTDMDEPLNPAQVLEHCLGIAPGRQDRIHKSRVEGILRGLGWKPRQVRLSWLASKDRATLYGLPERWWANRVFIERYRGVSVAPRSNRPQRAGQEEPGS